MKTWMGYAAWTQSEVEWYKRMDDIKQLRRNDKGEYGFRREHTTPETQARFCCAERILFILSWHETVRTCKRGTEGGLPDNI